jgi:hypothetical protein
MKKGLFTMIATAAVFGAFAQKSVPAVAPAKVENIKVDNKHELKVNSAGGQMSQWFGYAALQEELNAFDANAPFLFPDSNVKVVFVSNGQPGSYYNTWFALGQAFDPKDPEYAFSTDNIEVLSKFNNYTIDSLNLLYLYDRRITDTTTIDTMIVKVYKTNAGISYWNFGATNVFAVVEYDRINKEPAGAANVIEFRIPLTHRDTNANSGVWGEKLLALTNYSVTRDQEVAVAVSFKPGFTFNNGDTMFATSDINPQPAKKFNTFRVRTVDNNSNVEHSYYNNGLAVDKTQAFTNRLTGAGFETTPKFLPSNYYGVSQFLDVRFKVSSPNVGVKDINGNGFGLGEVYPNPASNKGNITVPFAMGKSGEATLKITNVIGQDVITVSDKFNAGENSFDVNVNGLKPGVYFCTVSSGNFTATKKVTITQ